MRPPFLLLSLCVAGALHSACGVKSPCGPQPQSGCLQSCCTDHLMPHVCEDDAWVCPDGWVDSATCNTSCLPPPASGQLCVDRDAGACLGCPDGEKCHSTFRCEDDGDGGVTCGDAEWDAGTDGSALAPDDRCYAPCNFFGCPSGTSCAEAPSIICNSDLVLRESLCLPSP